MDLGSVIEAGVGRTLLARETDYAGSGSAPLLPVDLLV